MGTRHLTAVFLDSKYQVAQYGQWDSYPRGAGINCLNFVHSIVSETARKDFANKVRDCSWATQKYIDSKVSQEDWQKNYPELSRDTGSNLLQLIQKSEKGLKLVDVIDFAADGFMCEWVWVIDLDHNTFEGFKGFNNKSLTPDDRFYFLQLENEEPQEGFYPARLIKKWQLDNLSIDEEFLAAFAEEN